MKGQLSTRELCLSTGEWVNKLRYISTMQITATEVKKNKLVTYTNTDESSNNYSEWNKPDSILYNSIYIKLQKVQTN